MWYIFQWTIRHIVTFWQRVHFNEMKDVKNNYRNNNYNILSYIFYKLFSKLRSPNNIIRSSSHKTSSHFSLEKMICVILIIVPLIIWIISGFYTIQETDRGVITRFGKLNHIVEPGLNWKLKFIDNVHTVNVETVRQLVASGIMLTSDENVVHVEMNIQYRVANPSKYLFSVANPDDSLRQATDSALRGVISKYSMDTILTEGRTIIRSDTQIELEKTILPYDMGLRILDVNFQAARPPEQVKSSFDDAIAARENEQQYIREAEAYANEVQPQSKGKAERIIENAYAYKIRSILEAQGEVMQFNKILSQYKAYPQVTKKRLYIETMEHIISNTRNFIFNDETNHPIVIMSVPQFFSNNMSHYNHSSIPRKISNIQIPLNKKKH